MSIGQRMKMAMSSLKGSKNTKSTPPTSWPSSKAVNVSKSPKPLTFAMLSQWFTPEKLSAAGIYETVKPAMDIESMERAGMLVEGPQPPSHRKYHSEQWRLSQARGKPWLQCCWELPDWAFISAIQTAKLLRNTKDGYKHTTATRWDITAVIAGYPADVISGDSIRDYPGVPPNLIRAKALKLIKRGIIDGCACGCRGDFSVIK